MNTSSPVYIHPDAQIHPSAVISPFAFIEGDVIVGEGCYIGPHACLMNGTRLGKNVKVYPGAVISAVPQDLKFNGEVTTTEIGDNTTIREYVTISRGTSDKFFTKVGSDCLIMAYVHIAHDCVVGNRVILGNTVQLAGHIEVDDWAIISGASAVHQFVKIGAHAMIAGGSLIRKDVPPFIKAAREPLSFAGVNLVGLRRRGFSNEQIDNIHNAYRVIFQSGLPVAKAIEQLQESSTLTKEAELIINFLKKSSRGIIGGGRTDIDSKEKDIDLGF